MKKLNIFLGHDVFEHITGDLLAVDSFALSLIKAGYKDFDSIGDFDSCNDDERSEIFNLSNAIEFESEKDETDLELALLYARDNFYEEVVIYNIICGNRLDQLLYNFKLVLKYKKYFNIVIKDRYNLMYEIKGSIDVNIKNYKYVSFLNLNDIESFTVKNVKYELDNQFIDKFSTMLISNELIDDKICVKSSDDIYIIFSND